MDQGLIHRVEPRFDAWQNGIVFIAKRHRRRKDEGAAIKKKVGAAQRELQTAVREGPISLGRYLRKELGLKAGESIQAPEFPRRKLTDHEYLNPPVELEAQLGRSWSDAVPASWASNPAFWLLCHVEWIEQGRLGRGDLTKFLLAGQGRPDLEGMTRNLLRRTGGIPIVRGKTSVFSDCTIARAWWRHRLAGEVADASGGRLSASKAHRALHANRPAWERLVMLSLRRLTVIGHPRAKMAMVREMSERLDREGTIKQNHVTTMGVELARLGLRHSLGHLRFGTLAVAATHGYSAASGGNA